MGMFDSVMVGCPKCGTPVEFQSKAGDCTLVSYSLDEAPDDILLDIDRKHETCGQCGQVLTIEVEGYVPKRTLRARVVPIP